MVKPKLNVEKLDRAARRLRSIAHPMRIAIIDLLSSNEKMNVTQLYESLGIEQAATSHHLNILRNSGILSSKRDGKMIFYFLQTKVLVEIIDCINRCDEA
ncbi:MAG: metalloregulator ArsR/SmtB family transcription factor [Bacteroidales bacterium]|nr:metalloregulator ArsR/SmtB family transcription factor [Bacteroidales bacterium]